MLFKLKLAGLRPGPRWGGFSAPLNPLADLLGVIRAGYCILYEQFSHTVL